MGLFSLFKSKKKDAGGAVEEAAAPEAAGDASQLPATPPGALALPVSHEPDSADGQLPVNGDIEEVQPAGVGVQPPEDVEQADCPEDADAAADAAVAREPDLAPHVGPPAAQEAILDPASPRTAPATPGDAGSEFGAAAAVESSCGSCNTPGRGSFAALDHLRRPSPAGSIGSEGSMAASRVDWVAAAALVTEGGAGPSQKQLSARRQIRQEMGREIEARLQEVFVSYASFGTNKQRLEEIDCARFSKLCGESGLLCRRFTRGYADVTFTLAKKRKELRRLTFDDFCTALRLAAFRKRCPLQEVAEAVAGCSGPRLNDVTTPEVVRLYDDLSTWTGVQFKVAADAAFAVPTAQLGPELARLGGTSGGTSLGTSGTTTPGSARCGSLAELATRQTQLQHELLDPSKAASEAAAAERRRKEAEAVIRQVEAEAKAAVGRAAAADEAARAKAKQAAEAAAAAEAAIRDNSAAADKARREAAALHEAAAHHQELARAAEREAAAALRKAAAAEKVGQAEAEAALAVAAEKEQRAKDAAANAWAAAAAASEAAEAAAAAAAKAAQAEGWTEEGVNQVAAAQEEAEAAAMNSILAARQEAEAAMIDALAHAEAAEAAVEVARAEAAAAAEALEAAKAEAAALLAAAATAEAAAETETAAKQAAEVRAAAAKEAAVAAAVARRNAAARARLDAEKAAAAAQQRRESAAAAARQAADAAVRAQSAVNSRIRAQQKLADALARARATSLAAAASAAFYEPATPEQRPPPPAALVSPEAAAEAAVGALEAAKRRFGDGRGITTADLKKVWREFAVFGKKAQMEGVPRMEGSLFAKLCRECCLIDGKLTSVQVDLTYRRVSDKGRPISFKQFMEALPLLAAARGCDETEVRLLVAAAEGPIRRGTTPLAVRFHDRAGRP